MPAEKFESQRKKRTSNIDKSVFNPHAVGIVNFKWCNLKNSKFASFWAFYKNRSPSVFCDRTQMTIFVIFKKIRNYDPRKSYFDYEPTCHFKIQLNQRQ